MKILPIANFQQQVKYTQKVKDKNVENHTTSSLQETTGIPGLYAYQDYNISFGARLFRTPQNFYEQEFNEQNMPVSLHKYIYEEGNPEFKRSIPPAQAMKEVFGKINDEAKNLDDVKRLYPKEPLFENLTSKPNKNSREGLLGLLNLLKDDPDYTDKTLFKNGDDDLGLYILKKIYIEGKTLKEINKDFNNDANSEFLAYDIKPSDYNAFGIRFPEQSFWRSFVATRNDFPYVFIPRTSKNTKPEIEHTKNQPTTPKTKSEEVKKEQTVHKPRYSLQTHRRNKIRKDIIESKGDSNEIKRKLVKHFTKNDPEASFIVKYISPIMTIAADRIHLSEEMRVFADLENIDNNNTLEKTFFKRFWNANPQLLQNYSVAITDSIEFFENEYGAGGMIPMNKDFEEIQKNSIDKKAIDYVTPEFLELLNYTKTIKPSREARYVEHENQQALWEAHFNERYGDINSVNNNEEVISPSNEPEIKGDKIEDLQQIAKEHGADIYELKAKDGSSIYLTLNIDEVFDDYFKRTTEFFPDRYRREFLNYIKTNPEITDKYKLSVATQEIKDLIADEQVMSDEEFEDVTDTIFYSYYLLNNQETMAAEASMADVVMKNYKTNEEMPLNLYSLSPSEYKELAAGGEDINKELKNIFSQKRGELNTLYKFYTTKATTNETLKISRTMISELRKYNPENSIAPTDIQEMLLMLKEMLEITKFKKEKLSRILGIMIPNLNFSKTILDKSLNAEQRRTRFEQIMKLFIYDMLSEKEGVEILRSMLNRELIEQHKSKLSKDIYHKLTSNEYIFNNPIEESFFNCSLEELKRLNG